MAIVVMAVDANAHTDATDMNADNGSVRGASAQQGEGENRGNESFHDGSFGERATPPVPNSAWIAYSLL